MPSGTYLFLVTGSRRDTKEILRSADDGATWAPCNKGLPEKVWVTGLVEIGPDLVAGTWHHGVFLSTDKGDNWKAINAGWPNGVSVTCIRASAKYLFAVTSDGDVLRFPVTEISAEKR